MNTAGVLQVSGGTMRGDTCVASLVPAEASLGAEVRGAGAARTPICYIVEDDEQICHFLSLILFGQGVCVEEYSDRVAFEQAVDQRSPDLVFLNVEDEPAAALYLIESLGKRGYFGFVQLTSNHRTAVLEEVKKAGEQYGLIMLPVLPKPFQTESVINIIRELKLGGSAAAAKQFSLAEALANNWIEYWYQPKIQLRHKKLIGAEAFVRARHPDYGSVMPATFMPGASDAALLALAEHCVGNLLKAGAKFAALGFVLRLSVNMSMNTLSQLALVDIVRSHRAPSGASPGFIIDVTEEELVNNLDRAADIAERLRHINVRIAVDDFGRNHAALRRMKEFPFAELKLGRRFIADCGTDKSRAPTCQRLIEFAHSLESVAVAVGIEKASEASALGNMGCDYGQGFLFGQPMPEDCFLSLLRLRINSKNRPEPNRRR